jgi:hypothetical protein
MAGVSSPFIAQKLNKMMKPIIDKYKIKYNHYNKRLEKIENDDIFE